MQLEMHYLNLCDRLGEQPDGKAVPVTVEELVDVFACTDRNAKLILRKMEEMRWIVWQPGRGRGNKSGITLLADREQRLMDMAKRHVDQGDVRAALQLVQLRSRNKEEMARFSNWLTDFFGYQKEGVFERPLETLRVPVTYPIGSLDPSKVYYVGEGHLIRQIFDTLVGYDFVKETPIPKLAHHWESDESRMKWTFYLRKGVLFHHRRELVSEDVVFTFERLRNHHIYFIIKKVTALDSRTVTFELHEPCAWFPRMVSFDSSSILPHDLVVEKGDDFFEQPIGTGPFQMVKKTSALCVLDAFPAYYSSRVHLDRVELHLMPSGDDIEACWDVIDKWPESSPEMRTWNRIRTHLACCRLLTFNFQRPGPQLHPSFRKALCEALDKEAIVASRNDDRFTASYGFTPNCGGSPSLGTPRSEEETARLIRQWLAEAGYDGSPLILELKKNHESESELIRASCERHGINIRFQACTHTDFEANLQTTDAHMKIQNVVFEDEELTLLDFVFSDRSAIGFHLLDEETKKTGRQFVRNMFAEETSAGRLAWVNKLSELLQDTHSVLFLFHFRTESYYSPRVGGVQLNSLGLIDFRNVWFKA